MNVTDDTQAVYQPAKKKRSNRESKLQQACVTWFKLQHPDKLLIAIPNGGGRSATESKILIGEGVYPGIPDLVILEKRGSWGGLFLEMKVHPNVPSEKQLAAIDRLVRKGYACQVIYSLEVFIETVTDYLRLPYVAGPDHE